MISCVIIAIFLFSFFSFLHMIMLVLVHVQGFKPKTLSPKPRMAKGLKKQKQMGLQIG
jgi:hypothetical protein